MRVEQGDGDTGEHQARGHEDALGQRHPRGQEAHGHGQAPPGAGAPVLAGPGGAARPQCAGEPWVVTLQPCREIDL